MSRPRRWFRRLVVLALAGAVSLGAVALESHRETSTIRLASLELASSKLTGTLKVLQVTDTHDLDEARWRQVVDRARLTDPDLIALTGDVVNVTTTEFARLDAFMAELVTLDIPVYYVQGNHDDAHLAQVLEVMQRHGVHVLRNHNTSLDGAWGRLDVVGTSDYQAADGNLPAAMSGTRADAFQLVLTHDPGVVDDLARSGAELAICGHTHGGQVRVPGIGALYAPGQGLLPTYDKGLFEVGSSQLYVDSGAGQSGGPRLFTPAQVTLITLHP